MVVRVVGELDRIRFVAIGVEREDTAQQRARGGQVLVFGRPHNPINPEGVHRREGLRISGISVQKNAFDAAKG